MIAFHDRAQIKGGTGKITPEGYFVADALVARANNIQEYRASELGLTDRAPDAVVRVFRPEAEVFATDSVATAAHIPVTVDHPPVMVDAANVLQYRRGGTGGDVMRDGDFMRIPLRIEDAAAVTAVRTTHREFSLGYSADLKLEAGVFDGKAYDASITNLRYNHLATCRTARGGPELRIVDERPDFSRQPEGNPMPHIVLVDGLPVDVSNAETAATVVKSAITARDTAQAALEASQTALGTANTTIAARDAEIVTLKDAADKAKLTPQQLRDAAGDYARVVATAKALGATVTDAMDAQAIRAAVVAHKMPTATFATDAETNAAFAVLAADVKPATVTDAADPMRAMLTDGSPATVNDAAKAFADARAARFARFENAHHGATAAAAN